jgi:hypothetical protein
VDSSTNAAYADSSRSIDAVLATSGTTGSATSGETGSPLFLINLYASMAPVALPNKALPGLENYRLYQVSRREDGRTRYRVRLGFFATEAEAETVLEKVRAQYPTAFTACVCEEDQRHARGYAVQAPPQMRVVPNVSAPEQKIATPAPSAKAAGVEKPAVTAAPKMPTAAAPTPKPAAQATLPATSPSAQPIEIASLDELSWDAPAAQVVTPAVTQTQAAKPAANGVTKSIEPKTVGAQQSPAPAPVAPAAPTHEVELTFDDPPPVAPTPTSSSSGNEPFHVGRFHAGKGLEIPTTNLTLEPEPSAAPAAKQATPTPTPAPEVAKRAPPIPKRMAEAMHLELDSTQTIRALTAEELEDAAQEKWFAIELAVSDQPVNLDAMPHLDIFEAYRVYSVANAANGKITHSMRLGFFKESVSAEAVAGYLKTFFSTPTVLRISIAEHARFKDATVRKRPASHGAPNVIELEDARASRVPTVTMAVGAATKPTEPAEKTVRTQAAKSAPVPTKRSAPLPSRGAPTKKTSTTGKYAIKKSLSQELLEEAKRTKLSETGSHKVEKNGSLLSRLVGKLKKS